MAVNRTKVLEAAQKFLSKGQYDKAIAEYQKLVAEDPRDVRTLLKIGDLHTRRNKPKDAIDVYQKVAELYAKQGFFLKAVAVYKQILKLDPTHIDSSQKLAKMYEELALTSDALTTYEQVADAYLAQNQTQKALETMERMVELDGTNVAVRIKYAEALSKLEKAKEAAKAFADAAHLLKEQGRMDDYIRVVERQLYHDANNLDIARELSSLYLERSDPKRALAKLQLCFKADPRDVQTLEMLAEAFRQLGQIPKTISVLKEIARLHQEVGATEPRRRTLRRVLDLDPHDAEAKQGLAQMGGAAAPRTTQAMPVAAPAPAQPVGTAPGMAAPAKPSPTLSQARPQPQPARPMSSPLPPVPDPDDIDLEAEAAEELDLLEQDDDADEVLLMDEQPQPAPAPSQASASRMAAPQQAPRPVARPAPAPLQPEPSRARAPEPVRQESKQDKITRLLEQADEYEGTSRYEAAEAALKEVLGIEPEHLPTHERLKDLYLATDRRVDAVRELLWLSDAWTERNTERAIQYAKAAYDLAPHADATKSRLEALGVDVDSEQQEEVMFVDDSRSERFDTPVPDDGVDAELDAILPPVSDGPPSRSAGERMGRDTLARSSEERLDRNTRDSGARGAVEDPLDIPLSPDDFDAQPPSPRALTVSAEMVLELLDQPITPEDFDQQDDQFAEPAVARAPAVEHEDRFGADGPSDDDMASLLDAPISPDEFDAPPPRREATLSADMDELLAKPLPVDDFGLSDERFDRSGLIDVEAPSPKRPSTPAEVLAEDNDEPSIEFAEIGTGEIDMDEAEAELMRGRSSRQDDEPEAAEKAPQTLAPRKRETGEFNELGTGEIMVVAEDDEPEAPAKPRGAGLVPPVGSLPPLPPPPPQSLKPRVAPPPTMAADDGPDPTIPGEPIPDLIRRSAMGGAPKPAALEPPKPTAAKGPVPTVIGKPTVPMVIALPPSDEFDFSDLNDAPKAAAQDATPTPAAGFSPGSPQLSDAEVEGLFEPPAPAPAAPVFQAKAPAAPVVQSAPPSNDDDEVMAPEVEEALDEADFFASQGLMEEALEVVQEAILIYPNSKALKKRLLEYEAKADEQEAEEESKAQAGDASEDESFDIAEQLAGQLSEVQAPAAVDEMVDVESVFAQFKKGVAEQIAPDDSDTHFDLGIAYKEMGLTDDAMQEFEVASRNPKRACTALTMIGMCCLEKGDAQKAVGYFERALASNLKSPAEELALWYEIGNAHELLGQLDKAIGAFDKAASRDRTFRGVAARLDQLRKRGGKTVGATR